MAVIDPAKQDLAKAPAKPGDWIKHTVGGKTTLVRVPYPGLATSWAAGDRPTPSDARVSR